MSDVAITEKDRKMAQRCVECPVCKKDKKTTARIRLLVCQECRRRPVPELCRLRKSLRQKSPRGLIRLPRLQRPADRHDFRFLGAFVKFQNFRVTIPFLHGIFLDVPIAAVQFHCIIGAKHCRLSAVEFGHRGQRVIGLALIDQPRGFIYQPAQSFNPYRHFCKFHLCHLIRTQRRAESGPSLTYLMLVSKQASEMPSAWPETMTR